jgi:gluconokinase
LADYRIVVLMGVAGTGKSTVGQLLAQRLGWPFFDGDDFHPQANVDKMAAGRPLTDADRWPWLAALRGLIGQKLERGETAVIACSALKASYRARLLPDDPRLALVHLTGSPALIQERLQARPGHFFDASLLTDQLTTLEPPQEAAALTVDIQLAPAEIVTTICRHLSSQTICE